MNKIKIINKEIKSINFDSVQIQVEESIPELLTNYLLDWLEKYVEEGKTIENEETLQFGFSMLKFQIEKNILHIKGPDYKLIPFNWTKNLTNTFLVFKEQKFTVESFNLESEYAKLQDTAIVGIEFDKQPFIMSRYEPSKNNPNDSGWFIGSLKEEIDNNNPKNLSVKSLYEIVLKQPLSLPYLFFPKESFISFKKGEVEVVNGDYFLKSKKGSYVEQKAANTVY
ncbi:hypothetical protein HNV08_03015 [Winogradskyella eckloniae]|uniref:immunity protein Imm33 domain-containing protein n=1 Tax=Winogradskyella eckloniae TaxID=1089306 RepID=UPI001564B49C|nr:hypothetical protein [Winogradskyella eckloniae]NRD19005.1 hypothetical protein [Winogradskyella eckloniae]